MNKTVKVKYTFEITRDVTISDETPPPPYTQEEWESQQIQNLGDDIEFSIDGPAYWYFQILDGPNNQSEPRS